MNRIKISLTAILVVILLTFAVSGTIAWLQDSTEKVENVFTPTKVETDIDEPGWEDGNTVKSEVVVKNTGSIPVYVRVAVIGNWVKDGKIVESWSVGDNIASDWIQIGDYYYYKNQLENGATTANLLKNSITASPREDGAHLEVTVVHQSIQAEPTSVASREWNVKIEDDQITGAGSAN